MQKVNAYAELVKSFAYSHYIRPGDPYPDSFPAHIVPGVFGHIAGYLGVVEPQMRKALHIHMLIQLLGFSHPEDIFRENVLPEVPSLMVFRCEHPVP